MTDRKGPVVVICAIDGSGVIKALEVDANDYLKVALATASGSDLLTELESKLETAQLELITKALSTGPHGWVGGAWQRNALPLAYSGRVSEYKTETSVGDPATPIWTTPVPAGEIHTYQAISVFHEDDVPRDITMYLNGSGNNVPIMVSPLVTPYVPAVFGVPVTLEPDDYALIYVAALASGKECKLGAWGLRTDIDQ